VDEYLNDSAAGSPLAGAGGAMEDDYLTVTMLSAGLAEILQRRAFAAAGGRAVGGRGDDGLLPAVWRVAFSRLWWRFTAQGAPPLASDLELLALCQVPLVTWPVTLRLSEADLQNPLLVDRELSSFAEQGARLARVDVEAEWVETRVHQALRAAASANGADEADVERVYAFLRRYLIDRAVLTDRDVQVLERRFGATDSSGQTYVRRLIEAAYVARPAAGPERLSLCPQCRNVLVNLAGQCGTAGCAGGPAETVVVTPLAAIFEQHRATRRFIHDPGLVEARIIDALSVEALAGTVRVTPYPGVDLLDVLIEFLAKDYCGKGCVVEAWGVDAKDQVSASLLGREFTWPSSIDCQRRFLALPMHRAERPGYVADLEAELDGRVAGVRVVSEQELIAKVKARARRLTP
jgi:REase associating with pPIWI_RE